MSSADDSSGDPFFPPVKNGVSATPPALLETTTAALVEDLVASAGRYASAAVAPNTTRAYRADWAHFTAFCASLEVAPLPASPETVGAYITSLADAGAAAATIDRRLSTIRGAHRAAGLEPPASEALRLLRRGIRRTIGTAQRQATALGLDDLRRMVGALPADCILDAARDRAVLLVGFVAALRRSEVAALEVEDVRFESAGMVITVRRSKTDQEGAGRVVAVPYARRPELCAVLALRAYLEAAGRTTGRVFGIGEKTVCRIVHRAAVRAGLDPALVSGHSLRAGFATAAASAGVHERDIQRQTGHKSTTVLRRYIRAGEIWRDNAAGALL